MKKRTDSDKRKKGRKLGSFIDVMMEILFWWR